jgi:hypothetical protein
MRPATSSPATMPPGQVDHTLSGNDFTGRLLSAQGLQGIDVGRPAGGKRGGG